MARGAAALFQILIIQQISQKYGTGFVGIYSTAIFPATFFSWVFSLGITNTNIFLLTEDSNNLKIAIYNGKSVIFTGFLWLVFILPYLYFSNVSATLWFLISLIYITFIILIVINSILIGLGFYNRYSLTVLFQFGIVFLGTYLTNKIGVSTVLTFWLMANLFCILINIGLVWSVLSTRLTIGLYKKSIILLMPSFRADTITYALNRGDFLLAPILLSSGLVGVYYIYLQFMEGFNAIVKLFGPILQREISKDSRKTILGALGIFILISLLIIISLLTFDFWVGFISDELRGYQSLMQIWFLTIGAYTFYNISKFLVLGIGKFNYVYYWSLVGLIVLFLSILAIPNKFLAIIFVKLVVFLFLGIVFFMRVIKERWHMTNG